MAGGQSGQLPTQVLTKYSQVSIKQARLLNYFEEIFHPARLTIFDKKNTNLFLYSFF
jgi:hypothetical protein